MVQSGQGRMWYVVRDALEGPREKTLHRSPFMKTNTCTGSSFVSPLLRLAIVSFRFSLRGKVLTAQRPK